MLDADLDDLLGALDAPSPRVGAPDALAPGGAGSSAPRSLAPLCVRIHQLTHAQAERIAKWAVRLPVDVLADVTVDEGVRAVELLRSELGRRRLLGRVRILEFTSADMERAYPALRDETLESYRRQHAWMLPARSHAWAYTAEALAVTGLGREGAPSAVEHVWCFEHDADWSGDIDEVPTALRTRRAPLAGGRRPLHVALLRPRRSPVRSPAVAQLVRAYASDDADLIAKELDVVDGGNPEGTVHRPAIARAEPGGP